MPNKIETRQLVEHLSPVNVDLEQMISPSHKVVFFGESEHTSALQHSFEASCLPQLSRLGFTTLALEGISPDQNQNLSELGNNYRQTHDFQPLLDYSEKHWGASAGDCANQANVLRTAFDTGLEVVGIDADQQVIESKMPKDMMEVFFPDPDVRQQVDDILNGRVDMHRLIEEEGMEGLVKFQNLTSQIGEMFEKGAQKLAEFMDKVVLKERDVAMSSNLNLLLAENGDRRIVVSIGSAHIDDRPESTRTLTNADSTSILVADDTESSLSTSVDIYKLDPHNWVCVAR